MRLGKGWGRLWEDGRDLDKLGDNERGWKLFGEIGRGRERFSEAG